MWFWVLFPSTGLDTSNAWGCLLLNRIYQSTWLLSIYKIWKYLYGAATGTTELLRICDGYLKLEAERRGSAISQSSSGSSRSQKAKSDTDDLGLIWKVVAVPFSVYKTVLSYFVSTSSSSSTETTPLLSIDNNNLTLPPTFVLRIDKSLLFSSKLKVERRQLESKEGYLPKKIDEIHQSILLRKRFPQNGAVNTPHAVLIKQVLVTMASSYKLLHELNMRAATKYDPENKAHERKLLELWDLLVPSQKLVSRISKQWELIGFQGVDPATDFRGMGILGLDDLYYFAKTYPEVAAKVLRASQHPTSWFSLAITGINITSFTLQLVRTRQLQRYFYTFGATKEMYHEFYCYVFSEFCTFWTSHSTPLTVMDFGRVFKEFQSNIERDLSICKSSTLLSLKKESERKKDK